MEDKKILSVYELNDIIRGLRANGNKPKRMNLYCNGNITMDIIKVPDSEFLVAFSVENDTELIYGEEAYKEKETYSAYIMTYFKYMEEVRKQYEI